MQATEQRHWEEAINHFNLIIELRSDYKDTAQLLDRAHQSLKKANHRQFVATRYQEGVAHLEQKRWDEAVFAFVEVQKASPGYQQVEELLAEAQTHSTVRVTGQFNNVSLEAETANSPGRQWWRWGLVGVGLLLIGGMLFMWLGNNNRVTAMMFRIA
jgi:tetratricopeptide (TPR) repeat protein